MMRERPLDTLGSEAHMEGADVSIDFAVVQESLEKPAD